MIGFRLSGKGKVSKGYFVEISIKDRIDKSTAEAEKMANTEHGSEQIVISFRVY